MEQLKKAVTERNEIIRKNKRVKETLEHTLTMRKAHVEKLSEAVSAANKELWCSGVFIDTSWCAQGDSYSVLRMNARRETGKTDENNNFKVPVRDQLLETEFTLIGLRS